MAVGAGALGMAPTHPHARPASGSCAGLQDRMSETKDMQEGKVMGELGYIVWVCPELAWYLFSYQIRHHEA